MTIWDWLIVVVTYHAIGELGLHTRNYASRKFADREFRKLCSTIERSSEASNKRKMEVVK